MKKSTAIRLKDFKTAAKRASFKYRFYSDDDPDGFIVDGPTFAFYMMDKVVAYPDSIDLLPAKEFWKAIKWMDWPKRYRSGDGHQEILEFFSKRSLEFYLRFMETFDHYYGLLFIALHSYEVATWQSANVSDDSQTDLLSHIIGLGEQEYRNSLAIPQRIVDRGHSNQYRENFSYLFPSIDQLPQFENLTIIEKRRVAKGNRGLWRLKGQANRWIGMDWKRKGAQYGVSPLLVQIYSVAFGDGRVEHTTLQRSKNKTIRKKAKTKRKMSEV